MFLYSCWSTMESLYTACTIAGDEIQASRQDYTWSELWGISAIKNNQWAALHVGSENLQHQTALVNSFKLHNYVTESSLFYSVYTVYTVLLHASWNLERGSRIKLDKCQLNQKKIEQLLSRCFPAPVIGLELSFLSVNKRSPIPSLKSCSLRITLSGSTTR